jgi:predicted SprT family Zn-dependent metalloprotease
MHPRLRGSKAHAPYTPTPRKLAHWFRVINAAYFQGQLPTPVFRLESIDGGMAYTDGGTLALDPGYTWTFQMVFNTVAHEMIHLWQYHTKNPLDHGPLFQRHAKALRKLTGHPV